MLAACQRFFRGHVRVFDVVLAVVLLALSVPGSRISFPGADVTARTWVGVLLTGIACVFLPWRRSHPRTVAVLAAACGIAVAACGFVPSMFVLGPLIVMAYTLAERTDRKTANSITFTAVVLVACAAVLAHPHETIYLTVIAPAASMLLPLSLGTTIRIRRAYLQAVRARAEFAEQTREKEARHRVAEERMRIARELHDVVAHHLALANAQAGTVAHVMRSNPEQAAKMVEELAGTTSSALRELKATVGLLRQTDESDESGTRLQPAPGLSRLPELTAALASAGLNVAVTTEGSMQPLSPGVDLTAYRIIQEALTNVTKHATTKDAQVRLSYSRNRLTVTVTNDSRSAVAKAPAPGSGFGLIGMRERAQSVGGTVHTGRRDDGVFEVFADLPLYNRLPEKEPTP
jgi:signal transduction histidine kinase